MHLCPQEVPLGSAACSVAPRAAGWRTHLVVVAAQAEHAGLAHHVPDDDIRVLGAGGQQRASRIELQSGDRRLRQSHRLSNKRRDWDEDDKRSLRSLVTARCPQLNQIGR